MNNFTRIFITTSVVLMISFSAYSQQIFKIANVGIGTINPTEKLDVVGNVKFSQALMPNNLSGSVGNILLSEGANVSPTWLANGTTGQVLTISAGVPTWTTQSLTGGWALTGNSIVSTNFLGTTDAQPLVFKVNGTQAGRIDLNFASSGIANTYLGSFGTVGSITYGSPGGPTGDGGTVNVGIGISALGDFLSPGTTTGGNVAVGAFALPAAAGGDFNVAVGAYSQLNAVFASNNAAEGFDVAVGAYTLYSNTLGFGETALGYQSMYGSGAASLYGNYNSALGYNSLYNISSGGSNTALGSNSLYNTTTAGRNVGVGDSSLYSNTTGEFNIGVGYQSNVAAGNLTNAIAIGYQATAPVSNSITLGNSSVTSLYLPGYTAIGSIFYTSAASGLVSALAPGTSGFVLESTGAGSAPTWVNVAGVNNVTGTAPIYSTGGTTPAISIQGLPDNSDKGGVLYSTGAGTSAVFIPTGTANFVLQSNGTSAPTWVSPSAATGWALTGNSGTTAGTNYLGTNDDEGLQFHIGGAYAGAIDPLNASSSAGNVYLGAASTSGLILNGAGNKDAGDNNVAIGLAAFASAGGPQNVGGTTTSTFGYVSSDVAVGVYAMSSCVYGGGNTALGAYSERFVSLPSANSTGGNTASGAYSMYSNSTGLYNTALGYYSMYGSGSATAVGNFNTAEGYQSLYTSGVGIASNTAIGSNSLYNTIASRNTGVGDSALVTNTTGSNNTAVGYDADVALNNLTNATAIGYQAQAPASNSITLGNSSVTSLYLPGYTSIGNILYTSAGSGLVSALTPGASGTVLESQGVGLPPTWLSVSPPNSVTGTAPIYSSGGTTPNVTIQGNSPNTDAGGVLYSTGAGSSALFTPTPASAGLLLTSSAAGAVPTWAAAPSASGAWSLTGNSGTTPATNFIGTTDAVNTNHGLVFKVNNTYAGSIDAASGSTGLAQAGNLYLGYGAAGSADFGGGTAATGNVALGTNVLGSIPTGNGVNSDVVIGVSAMQNATANNSSDAIGAFSQFFDGGSSNVSVGSYSLYSNGTGANETALGYQSMYGTGVKENMGSANTAAGYQSLFSITGGGSNTAIGSNALYSNTASRNAAVGDSALASNTTGSNNTAVGYQALATTVTGNGNTTGTNNTALGYFANVSTGTLTNATAIGAFAYAAQSNSLVLGSINGINGATANTNVGIGTNTPDADAALAIKTGHLETQAASTAAVPTAFAGSSVTSPSLIGTDVGGVVTFTVPASGVAGGQVTVTFANNYITPPTVIISPASSNTGAIMGTYQPYVTVPGSSPYNSFTINFTGAPSASSTLSFNYFVIETQ